MLAASVHSLARRLPPRPFRWAPFAVLLGALNATGLATARAPGDHLEADTRFPVAGSQFTFRLSGLPGASFVLKASATAKESELPNIGRVFLDVTRSSDIAAGVLDPAGRADVVLTAPMQAKFRGRVFYFQFGASSGGVISLSNAISIRIQSAPPSGARKPEALAITPDGSKTYVVHAADATVSVLDPSTNTLLGDMPIGRIPTTFGQSCRAAVDPAGRHVFVLHPALPQMTVIDTATDSISAQVAVPLACGDVAFDFSGTADLIYVTSERDEGVLVFTEDPVGTFTQTGLLPIQGMRPGPLVLLPSGDLMIADQESHEIEVIDPTGAPVARTPLGRLPMDLLVSGASAFVPAFTALPDPDDGVWEVLEIELSGFSVVETLFQGQGTDYLDGEASGLHLLFPGTGSGTLLVADALTRAVLEVVDLNPGDVPGTPQDVAFVPPPGGGVPDRLYVLDRFRETVRPIDLSSGPPFALGAEIALSHSGQPRRQLFDLTQAERGEWFFHSIAYFNGSATNLNPVTCATCHPRTFSYGVNISTRFQPPAVFGVGATAPYTWTGGVPNLGILSQNQFDDHGRAGGTLDPGARADLIAFERSHGSPTSPFLEPDGSRSPAAQAGQLVFEGPGQCSTCHPAPLFVPVFPASPDVEGGVGTGLAPINIPSLRGVWSSAPYLHDGSAKTLMDVLTTSNSQDLHGITSTLTQAELSNLVEYLKSL